jgi:hypothetical protein
MVKRVLCAVVAAMFASSAMAADLPLKPAPQLPPPPRVQRQLPPPPQDYAQPMPQAPAPVYPQIAQPAPQVVAPVCPRMAGVGIGGCPYAGVGGCGAIMGGYGVRTLMPGPWVGRGFYGRGFGGRFGRPGLGIGLRAGVL